MIIIDRNEKNLQINDEYLNLRNEFTKIHDKLKDKKQKYGEME
jgi:hypothetical protein